MMLRWLSLGLCAGVFFAAGAFADPVALRPRIEATGPSITLGDLFTGAGNLSDRAVAPAPTAGQVAHLPMSTIAAAASVAGLEFTPPAGLDGVDVVHPAGARAGLGPNNAQLQQLAAQAPSAANVAVRRGQQVTLLYQVGGLSLSARMQAMEDGAIGQSVRLANPSSNRVILATVTGPGAASASP
jgi:hypothetical protein